MAKAIFTTEATSSGGGRDGRLTTPDGILDQDVRMPPALGGPGGATNPEQLFAGAYATCFHSALRMLARSRGVALPDGGTVTAEVGLGQDEGGFVVSATLTGHLPGLDQAQADELMEAAHQVCPYSRATRGNVDVQLVAKV
jgi:lipoyl-dependent peroxiredoxin